MTQIDVELSAAPKADKGRALARVPQEIMTQLGLSPGDAVAILAKSKTHCRVIRGAQDSTTVEIDDAVAKLIGAKPGGTASLIRAKLPALTNVLITLDEMVPPIRPADLAEALFDLPLTRGDCLNVSVPGGQSAAITVTEVTPSDAGFFTADTILSVVGQPGQAAQFDEIGGLEDQIARVQEMVATPLERPDLFETLGIQPPRGILFTGPPGSGKTLLARAVAARTSATFFHIDGPEIVSKHYGDSEAALRQVFDAAARKSAAIIFIDEIDAIAPRRDAMSSEKQVERRVVAQLLTLLDGMSERGRVVVMAATNLPDSIDPALRRPGRLEREIIFRTPSRAQRKDILEVHLRDAPLADDVDLNAIAEASHGYVGADLAALAREAGIAALARHVAQSGGEQMVDPAQLRVAAEDLEHGLAATRPAILRDAVVESPTIRWSDIGGLDDVKSALTEAVLWPTEHRDLFRGLRVEPARGALLAGPPGSGKTLLARALATESGMNFIGVRPTRIMSQFLGEAERAVAELFAKARHAAPAILFFDEFDALARQRSGMDAVLDRVVAQFLVEMDGLARNNGVFVLAASNRPAAIDTALLRPGRIDLILTVPLPDAKARKAILEVHLADRSQADTLCLDDLVEETQGLSGADLAELVNSAARHALRRHVTASNAPAVQAQLISEDLTDALQVLRRRNSQKSADHLNKSGGVPL